MINAYEKTEGLTIGLFEILPEDAPSYGVVKGEFLQGMSSLVKLDAIVEKPTSQYATQHLGVDGKQYAVFMYALTYDLYETLERQYEKRKVEYGEFQLTPSLDDVTRSNGGYGLLIDGKRYDIGMPSMYRGTVANFGRR